MKNSPSVRLSEIAYFFILRSLVLANENKGQTNYFVFSSENTIDYKTAKRTVISIICGLFMLNNTSMVTDAFKYKDLRYHKLLY